MTPDASSAETPVFAAEITPHRSLSRKGAAIVLGVFAAVTALLSVPFYWLGAWPVVGFFGLDVLLLWLAFRMSFAQARAYERIVLTHLELMVRRVTHAGAAREWRFNPAWVRIETESDDEFGMLRLAVRARDARVEMGGALSPHERAEFAAAFGEALAVAKAGPRYAGERE